MSRLGITTITMGVAFIYTASMLALLTGGAIFAAYALVGLSLWGVLRMRRFKINRVGELTEAIALLANGEHAEGMAKLEAYAKSVRWSPGLHTMGLLYLAHGWLLGGDLRRAHAILLGIEEARWIQRGTLRASYTATYVSTWVMTLTLLGDHEGARVWLERGDRALSGTKRPALLCAELLYHCRRGDTARALARVESQRKASENLVGSHYRRCVRLLQLFCIEHTNADEYRVPSRDEERRAALYAVRDGRPGEYDYLAQSWPEMDQLLTLHGLKA
jgi:hypothetical protein